MSKQDFETFECSLCLQGPLELVVGLVEKRSSCEDNRRIPGDEAPIEIAES